LAGTKGIFLTVIYVNLPLCSALIFVPYLINSWST